MSLTALRSRFHPVFHARRIPGLRAVLRLVDTPVWMRLNEISFPVRGLLVSHASYRFDAVEPGIAALVRAITEITDVRRFADVGANFGYYSWLVGSRVSNVRLDLVEPYDRNTRLIEATLRGTSLRARLHALAASDAEGSMAFVTDPVSGATGSLETAGRSFAQRHWGRSAERRVRAVRLDSLGLFELDLLKVDVEGHECHVLAGATETVTRETPLVIVESFDKRDQVRAFLLELGYELFDADSGQAVASDTTNLFGLSPRFRPSRDELLDRWHALLERRP